MKIWDLITRSCLNFLKVLLKLGDECIITFHMKLDSVINYLSLPYNASLANQEVPGDEITATASMQDSWLIHTFTFYINTLRPRQDGCHFPDDILKCIFCNENAWILFTSALNFVPKGPINKIPSSVQIMAWRRSGAEPFSGPMMALFTDACMRHSASMS